MRGVELVGRLVGAAFIGAIIPSVADAFLKTSIDPYELRVRAGIVLIAFPVCFVAAAFALFALVKVDRPAIYRLHWAIISGALAGFVITLPVINWYEWWIGPMFGASTAIGLWLMFRRRISVLR